MAIDDALAIVLGGGEGSRLLPLTRKRAKPAMPFGGQYKVIDFVLSNLLHSDITRVLVLTQYEFDSLHNHIRDAWYPRFGLSKDRFIQYQSPRAKMESKEWYQGNADAVRQNLDHIARHDPTRVYVLGSDHVYIMDFREMTAYHCDSHASMTIAAVSVPLAEATRFGVLKVDADNRVVEFNEKPANPAPLPHDPTRALVSMGNYLFETPVLNAALASMCAANSDFGKDVIPAMLAEGISIHAYDFKKDTAPGQLGYWRDIGDIRQYYAANMELLQDTPPILLNHPGWHIRTYAEDLDNVRALGGGNTLENSIIAGGVVLRRTAVRHSILSPGLRVEDSDIEDSILLGGGTVIGAGSRIKRAIIDENVIVPPGTSIGHNHDLDKERFAMTDDGIVIVPGEYHFTDDMRAKAQPSAHFSTVPAHLGSEARLTANDTKKKKSDHSERLVAVPAER